MNEKTNGLKLKAPSIIIRARNITYTVKMMEKLKKLIFQLLEKSLIRDSLSPYSSLVFIVINHTNQVRGKHEWL